MKISTVDPLDKFENDEDRVVTSVALTSVDTDQTPGPQVPGARVVSK